MAYSLILINVVFAAYSLILAEVVFYSLCSLVSVKKDSPFIGILNSYQVFSSIVLAVGLHSGELSSF